MHKVLVNHLESLSLLPRKTVVKLTDCPGMPLAVYHRRKTTQQINKSTSDFSGRAMDTGIVLRDIF